TGVNTAFAANTRIGDSFIGPDGRQYELANVSSDTVISIAPAYLGPSVSGANYAVAPIQGYQKGLADEVRSWNNTYGQKMAALGTTGNYDILPLSKGGTGVSVANNADLLRNVGAMPVGGGTTLSPVFGSVRAATQGAVPNALGAYIGWNETNGNPLSSGAVSFTCNKGGGTGGFSWRTVNASNTAGGPFMTYSESGVLSVPLGIQINAADIASYGVNTNGAFVKLYNGTLICWKQLATDAITTAAGSIFVTSPYNSPFPSTFNAIPHVLHSGIVAIGSQTAIWSVSLSPPTINNFGNFRIASAVSLPGVGAFINVFAIGTWK
uniref:hypothetical protein n=1 Tax=Pseudomonas fluorescens TaxID=294 RepID=UPI000A9EAB77